MKKIYCISGLGADERVFNNLKIRDVSLQYLPWLVPGKEESIESYAARMSSQVDEQNPLLLGVSFGGMMAIEMAKLRQSQKIILISSVKSHHELPEWMKVCARLNLQSLIPGRSPQWISPIADYYLGARTEEEKILSKDFRQTVSPVYLHWAIDKVINWKNAVEPSTIYHIHGTHDKTFPISYVRPTHIIPNGEHLMVMNRASEISVIIERLL
jgi:hypothetical protein